ncbi:MAG TPA: Crp/Fnr family transcriptional regulator [Bryobacteraceae bacterium]|nr:Crp/Fnr family transcriptional regulator [Bryobacteraceae bacterium]
MHRLAVASTNLNPKSNRLLAALEDDDYDATVQGAQFESLKLHKRLHEQDTPFDAVYFPLTCMMSLLVTASGEPQMEMATIGYEGVVGATELIISKSSFGLLLIQIPGIALRIEANYFHDLIETRPALSKLIHRHTYALLRQVLIGSACNRIHTMEERCARWLLMTHDRARRDSFPLTQEFMSHMLGVRRATVNAATGALKSAGYIHYVRGQVTVLDRPGLESATCACYAGIVKSYATAFED